MCENEDSKDIENIDDDCDDEGDYDGLLAALQTVICENDAVIIMDVGAEQLKHVSSYCTVVTCDDAQTIIMRQQASELSQKMLCNPNYETQLEY